LLTKPTHTSTLPKEATNKELHNVNKFVTIKYMAVPKRKSSKSRSGIDTFARNKRKTLQGVKTKDGKGIKRPHVDEYIKL